MGKTNSTDESTNPKPDPKPDPDPKITEAPAKPDANAEDPKTKAKADKPARKKAARKRPAKKPKPTVKESFLLEVEGLAARHKAGYGNGAFWKEQFGKSVPKLLELVEAYVPKKARKI